MVVEPNPTMACNLQGTSGNLPHDDVRTPVLSEMACRTYEIRMTLHAYTHAVFCCNIYGYRLKNVNL